MSDQLKAAIRDAAVYILDVWRSSSNKERLIRIGIDRHIIPALEREIAAAEAMAYRYCAARILDSPADALFKIERKAEAAERRAKGTGGTT